MNTAYDWVAPWSPVDNPIERARLEAELARELCAEHVLFAVPVDLLARRQGTDDCLFEVADGRFAQVHLTWSEETDPQWPATDIYPTWEDWVRDNMAR